MHDKFRSQTKMKQAVNNINTRNHIHNHSPTLSVLISETSPTARVQHDRTQPIVHITPIHEYTDQTQLQQTDSDTEITEEYTTRFRRSSTDENTSTIKTKKTTIRKKKPSRDESDNVVVIEEEIDDLKPSLPSIPKKQFMPIEEVTGLLDDEENVPSRIDEFEEVPEEIKDAVEEIKEFNIVILQEDDTNRKMRKKKNTRENRKDIERVTEERTVEEEGEVPSTTVISKSFDEESSDIEQQIYIEGIEPDYVHETNIGILPMVTYAQPIERSGELVSDMKETSTFPIITKERPSELEEVRAEIIVTQEIDAENKPRKITKKRVIRRKGNDNKRHITEEQTIEEEGKAPTIIVVEKPEEIILDDEITDSLPDETQKTITVSQGLTPEGKLFKVTKNKVIRKIGRKQQVTETRTTEETGKKPQIEIITEPMEEIVSDEVVETSPITEFGMPTINKEVRETVTIIEESTKMGKPRRITRKKIIQRKGMKQQVTEEQIIEEEGKAPEKTIISQPEEEIIVEEITKPLSVTAFGKTVSNFEEEVHEVATVTFDTTTEGNHRRVTKKNITRKRGHKQQVTIEKTIEEEGKEPMIEIVEEPEEEVLFDITAAPHSISELEVSEENEKVREIVTVCQKIAEEGKPQKVTKKKMIRRLGRKQQITEEVTIEEEGKEPITFATIQPEEFVLKETIETLPSIASSSIPTEDATILEQVAMTAETTKKDESYTKIEGKALRKNTVKVEEPGMLIIEEKDNKSVTSKKRLPIQNEITENKLQPLPEETRQVVSTTEDTTPEGKRRKVTRKKIISKKGKVQQETEEKVIEEEGKEPLTKIIVQPEEEIIFDRTTDLSSTPLLDQLNEGEKIREMITISKEISETGKPRKITKKKIIRKRGQHQQITEERIIEEEGKAPIREVNTEPEEKIISDEITELLPVTAPKQPSERDEIREMVTITTEWTKHDKPKKITKKRIINRKGKIQQITEEKTIEQSGKAAVKTITVLPAEEIVADDSILPLSTTVHVRPSDRQEVREEITVTQVTTTEGKPRKITKKKIITKKGRTLQITEEKITEEEGKSPMIEIVTGPIEEIISEETSQPILPINFQEPIECQEIPDSNNEIEEVSYKDEPEKISKKKVRRPKIEKIIDKPTEQSESHAVSETVIQPHEIFEENDLIPVKKLVKPTSVEKIDEIVTVVEEITDTGKPRKITKKRTTHKCGKKQQTIERKIVKKEGMVPQTSMEIQPEEEIISEDTTKLMPDEVHEIEEGSKTSPTESKVEPEEEIISEESQELVPGKTKKSKLTKKKDSIKDNKLLEEIGEQKEKPKLSHIKIIEKKQNLQKLEITSPQPQFAKIQLRKAPILKSKDKKTMIPKILLRSRIMFIEYPPLMLYPKVIRLKPKFVQSGILSRNVEEAIKLKKRKSNKFNPQEYDHKDLAKSDLEFDELEKSCDKPQDSTSYQHEPKSDKPEDIPIAKLKIGKGKPKSSDIEDQEAIKLKTPSKKDGETEVNSSLQPIKKNRKKDEEKPKNNEQCLESIKFQPYDTQPIDADLEKQRPLDNEENLQKSEKPQDEKKSKRKPKKSNQEFEQTSIAPGKHQFKKEEETTDLNLKYKQGLKPEEKSEKIILKPRKKPLDIDEKKVNDDDNIKFIPFDQQFDEIPDEIEIVTTQEIIEIPEMKPKKITKKHIIKKRGKKQQITETKTVEEEGKIPICSIVEHPVEELISDETICYKNEVPIPGSIDVEEEIREQVTVSETTTEEGKPIKVIKKRTTKRKGKKQHVIEEKIIEEEGKAPVTLFTETPDEEVIFEDAYKTANVVEEIVPITTEEITERVTVSETISEEGIPQKITNKRVTKKKGHKQRIIEQVTSEEASQIQRITTTTTILEDMKIAPEGEKIEPQVVEEVIDDVQVTEVHTKGRPKKFTKKKTLKRKGSVEHITEQITVEEEGKAPIILIADEPFEEAIKDHDAILFLPSLESAVPVEEITEQIVLTEEMTERDKPKITIKKRIIKKAGKAQQVIEKITVEEEGLEPVTTIIENPVEEIITVENILPLSVRAEETLPAVDDVREQVFISQEMTGDDKPKKIIKRKIVKRQGKKQKVIEETETQEEGKAPVIEIVEYPIEEVLFEETTKPFEEKNLSQPETEEVVSEVQIVKELTSLGKLKSTTKKRKIKKNIGEDDKVTEEVIIEEEGKESVTTVEEIPLEKFDNEKQPIKPKKKKSTLKSPEDIADLKVLKGKLKPLSVKVEISDAKPIKPKILEIQKPQFCSIKLKKAPIVKRKDDKDQFPNILLRSCIKFFDWPPGERKPKLSNVQSSEIQNGVLSRNMTEARKLKTPKQKKDKSQEMDEAVPEKSNHDFEQLKEVSLEEVPDQSNHQQKPRKLKTKVTEKEILHISEKEEIPINEIIPEEKKLTELKGQEKISSIDTVDTIVTEEIEVMPNQKLKKKTRRKIIKSGIDKKPEITEEVTVEEEGQAPVTTITLIPAEGEDYTNIVENREPRIESIQPTIVESTREEVEVTEMMTEDGKPKKITKKKKTTKKPNENPIISEEITVEEKGKEPVKTVTQHISPQQEHIGNISKKLKPCLQIIEKRDQQPIRLKIEEPAIPLFAQMKLKKVRNTRLNDKNEKNVLPKFLLRSRISAIKWPPKMNYPTISHIQPNDLQAGILSRNMEDAVKLKKSKRKMSKLTDKELANLEKLNLEFDELKRSPLEKVDETVPYERIPKPETTKPQSPEKLKMGKGTMPLKIEEEREVIKLKKIPDKPQPHEDDEKPSKKEKSPAPKLEKSYEDTDYPPLSPFEPYDIATSDVELEELKKPELLNDETSQQKKSDRKPHKTKKIKPTQETETVPIIPASPGTRSEEEQPDKKFRIPEPIKPEEQSNKIKLKPWKKTEDISQNEKTEDDTIKFVPHDDIEEIVETVVTEHIEDVVGKKPRKIIKKRVMRKNRQDIPKVSEEVTVEEENKLPITTLIFENVPEDELNDLQLNEGSEFGPVQPKIISEIREEVTVTTIVSNDGKPKKVRRKRIIEKGCDDKKEITEVITIEEEEVPVIAAIDTTENSTRKLHKKPKHKKPTQPNDVVSNSKGELNLLRVMIYHDYIHLTTFLSILNIDNYK